MDGERQRWDRRTPRWTLAALAALASAGGGCKSGSWATKPSSWGQGGAAGGSLTAAPKFEGDVSKPSTTTKPYPTTGTPDGYVLDETTRTGGTAAPEAAAPLLEPSAVTYGSTPPPQPAVAAVPPSQPAAVSTPTSPPAIGPQVGPYASLGGAPTASATADAATAATTGLAAAPAFGESAPPRPTAGVPDQRLAELPPPSAALGTSRYEDNAGSRFGGSGFQPAATPAPQQPLPDLTRPSDTPVSPVPSAMPATPAMPAGPDALPGAISPPTRRPDPGYRPFGTSSYQPSRGILADDAAGPAETVQPASFAAPVAE